MNKNKKIIYIIAWIILGLLLSFIFHGTIELIYLKYASPANLNEVSVFGNVCFLPIWLIYLLPILGIIFGLCTGFFFWKKVYGSNRKIN
jgi:hypothetical protein